MKRLLLLLAAAVVALSSTAQAQWTYAGRFTVDTLKTDGNGLHGIAVGNDGRVFVQPFGATPGETVTVPYAAAPQPLRVIKVYNPNGTESATIRFIDYDNGTPRDTLGGRTIRSGTGVPSWDVQSGRGLRYCAAQNALYVSQFDTIFKIDATTLRGLAKVRPFPTFALGAVAVDAACNVFAQTVTPGGRNIVAYDANLAAQTAVVGPASDFTRTLLASADGNTVFETAFENPYAVVFRRASEFDPYVQIGQTMAGLRIESTEVDPRTGNYWVSSGNPLNGGNDYSVVRAPGDTLRVKTFYRLQAWYAFRPQDLFDGTGAPVLDPTPVDSIYWEAPNNIQNDTNAGQRPRGIAFSPDGNTAYVVAFNGTSGRNIQKFTRNPVASEGRAESFAGRLEQNRPNPVSGQTTFAFEIDQPARVALRVYDTAGRLVSTVSESNRAAGPHTVEWDASSLAAGVYVYTLSVDGQTASRRMIVVR